MRKGLQNCAKNASDSDDAAAISSACTTEWNADKTSATNEMATQTSNQTESTTTATTCKQSAQQWVDNECSNYGLAGACGDIQDTIDSCRDWVADKNVAMQKVRLVLDGYQWLCKEVVGEGSRRMLLSSDEKENAANSAATEWCPDFITAADGWISSASDMFGDTITPVKRTNAKITRTKSNSHQMKTMKVDFSVNCGEGELLRWTGEAVVCADACVGEEIAITKSVSKKAPPRKASRALRERLLRGRGGRTGGGSRGGNASGSGRGGNEGPGSGGSRGEGPRGGGGSEERDEGLSERERPKRTESSLVAKSKQNKKKIRVCVPRPTCSVKQKKTSEEFQVVAPCKLDAGVPRDQVAGFAPFLKCSFGEENIPPKKGTRFTVPYKSAQRVIGEGNVGEDLTLACELKVKEGGEGGTVLATKSATVNIPAPLIPKNYQLSLKSSEVDTREVTDQPKAFLWEAQDRTDSDADFSAIDTGVFDVNFQVVQLDKKLAEQDAIMAGEACAMGFEGRFDKKAKKHKKNMGEGGPRGDSRENQASRLLAAQKSGGGSKGDQGPGNWGVKEGGEGGRSSKSPRMDGGRFAPEKELPKSKKLCRSVRTNGANIPQVKGKFIGCVEIVHKTNRQEVKKCDKHVVDINFTEEPLTLLNNISTSELSMNGNESNAGERTSVDNKLSEVVNLTEAMRVEPSGENNLLRRILQEYNFFEEEDDDDEQDGRQLAASIGGGGNGRRGEGGMFGRRSKGEFDKMQNAMKGRASSARKTGFPLNISKLNCQKSCAGTCVRKGMRKTTCDCTGTTRFGKWCDITNSMKEKKEEQCTALVQNLANSCGNNGWDVTTHKAMLSIYRKGVRLCSLSATNLKTLIRQLADSLKFIQESDEPYNMKKVSERASGVAKAVKDTNWTAEQKQLIFGQLYRLFDFMRSEKGNKEAVEITGMQVASRTDDGGEYVDSDEMISQEVGSEDSSNTEISVSPSEFNAGDFCARTVQQDSDPLVGDSEDDSASVSVNFRLYDCNYVDDEATTCPGSGESGEGEDDGEGGESRRLEEIRQEQWWETRNVRRLSSEGEGEAVVQAYQYKIEVNVYPESGEDVQCAWNDGQSNEWDYTMCNVNSIDQETQSVQVICDCQQSGIVKIDSNLAAPSDEEDIQEEALLVAAQEQSLEEGDDDGEDGFSAIIALFSLIFIMFF